MEGSSCVRKGAWSQVEDDLLTACVRQYGEGKWHLVPTRAGLNRCRKSCRLRWLNYLKPTIKKGKFGEDEVDMMKRLHRLLGNRWSLIAGRLPGRTPNDVKNYWNTYIRNKKGSCHKEETKTNEIAKPHLVIKPQPRTFYSSRGQCLKMRFPSSEEQSGVNFFPLQTCASSSSALIPDNYIDQWWGNVIDGKGGNLENGKSVQDGMFIKHFNGDDQEDLTGCLIGDQTLSDFLDDINLWDL